MGRHKKQKTDSDKTNQKLKVITVNINVNHHKLLRELVKLGRYGSVSEAVRNMADDWLTWKIDTAKEIERMADILAQINEARDSFRQAVLEDNRDFVAGNSKKYNAMDVIQPTEEPMQVIQMGHPEKEVILREEFITQDGKVYKLTEYGYELDKGSYIAKNTDEDGFIRVPKDSLSETPNRMYINNK